MAGESGRVPPGRHERRLPRHAGWKRVHGLGITIIHVLEIRVALFALLTPLFYTTRENIL
jgi:hypothetical protein